MDSDNRKILFLAGAVVLILVAIFIFMFGNVFNDKENIEQSVTPFPESGERTDLDPGSVMASTTGMATSSEVAEDLPPLEQDPSDISPMLQGSESTDWRDEIVGYGTEIKELKTDGTVAGANSGLSSGGSPISKDDLVANGLMLEYPDPSVFYPKTVTLGDGRVLDLDDALDPEKFKDAVNPIPKLEIILEGDACGSITVPDGDSATRDFLNNLGDTAQAYCMGTAIANDCASNYTLIYTGSGTKIWLYVTKLEDGSCTIGSSFEEGYADLCELSPVMNFVTGYNLSTEDWIAEYQRDPGDTFAKLFTGENQFLGSSNSDCTLYRTVLLATGRFKT